MTPEWVIERLMRDHHVTRDQAERIGDHAAHLFRIGRYKTATGAMRRAISDVTTGDYLAGMFFPRDCGKDDCDNIDCPRHGRPSASAVRRTSGERKKK